MATAQLQGRWNVRGAVLPHNTSRLAGSLRASGLPFLSKQAELTPLRIRSVPPRRRKRGGVTAAAQTGREPVIDHGYDVYELLGVEVDAPACEIKQAYRWLQKRCHPDIAGPVGHDMAILLNDAYATLSNPMTRARYDVKRMESAAFDGYTGKPLYSKWLGPAEEDRAIFVDESQCVGCLKCALIASNTFAIENRYGRARAVGQWGDSEATINDAIRSCPVDCISFVQKEQLPALEFVMTKQPRVIVGVDMQTYGGQRNENVFVAAEKFLNKCAQLELAKRSNFQETAAQKEARMAAAENIQARAGHWWHHFVGKDTVGVAESNEFRTSRGAMVPLSWIPATERANYNNLPPTTPAIPRDQLNALLEAARRRRRQGKELRNDNGHPTLEDEYWSPIQPDSTSVPYDEQHPRASHPSRPGAPRLDHHHHSSGIFEVHVDQVLSGWMKTLLSTAPVAFSLVGAVFAGMTNGLGAANSSEVASSSAAAAVAAADVAGPLPAEVTSGVFMQMFLAAAVWYMIAAVVSGVTAVLAVSILSMRRGDQE